MTLHKPLHAAPLTALVARRGPLPPRATVELAMTLADALRRGRVVTHESQIGITADGAVRLTGTRLPLGTSSKVAIEPILELVMRVGQPTPALADLARHPPHSVHALVEDLRFAGARARLLHRKGLREWLVREAAA